MLLNPSLINLDLDISKSLSFVDNKLLMIRHRDFGCAADADGNEVVDPAADKECADSPDPGAEGE